MSITSSQADQVLDDLFASVERTPEPPAAPTFQPTPPPKPLHTAITQLATPPATPSPTALFARMAARAPTPPMADVETLPTPPMTPDLGSPSIGTSATMTPHTSMSPTVRSSVGGKDERSLSQQYAFLNFEPDPPSAAVDLRSFLDASPATPGAIAAARRESNFSEQQAELTGVALSPADQSLEDLSGLMAEQPPVEPLFASRSKPLPSPVAPSRPIVAPPRPPSVASKRSAPRQPTRPQKVRRPSPPQLTAQPSGGLFSCCSGQSYYHDED